MVNKTLTIVCSLFAKIFFRSLKRAENISRSPMFSHIECSVHGAATIRSFNRVKYFTEKSVFSLCTIYR